MFVVAPPPLPMESQMGYVLRLTELNGYPTTSYVLASMGREWYRSAMGRMDAAALAPLTGMGRADVERLTHRPDTRPRAYIRVYGSDLPGYEVNLRRPKVCTLCLAEGRPCEAFWDLAQAAACPVHRVALVDRCAGCGKLLAWSRCRIRACSCGADLREQEVTPASPALCDLMAVMRHLVYRDPVLAPLPPAMAHLAHLDLRRFCKLLWVMSGVVHKAQGGQRMPKARCHYKPQLQGVALALGGWPAGFRSFLHRTYDDLIEGSAELPRFRSLFSWLLIRLVKNDEEDGSCFAFLERELYLFGANYWMRSAMAREGGTQSLMPERMRWGSLTEAVQLSGLHQLTVKRRVASGHIKSKRISAHSTRGIAVDLDSIRERSVTQHPSVSIRDAAPMVGVSIETLKALRILGILEEKHYKPSHPGCLTLEDVSALAARLRALGTGQRANASPEGTTLGAAFIARTASPVEKAGLLARLLAQPDLVIGRVRGRGTDGLQVRKDLLEDYFRTARAEPPPCTTVLETAARLGCTADTVKWLKRAGHIATHKQHGRESPCLASVIAFDADYEALARVAARCGVTAKSALSRLDLTGPKQIRLRCSKHTTTFVHRRDVPKLEKALR